MAENNKDINKWRDNTMFMDWEAQHANDLNCLEIGLCIDSTKFLLKYQEDLL